MSGFPFVLKLARAQPRMSPRLVGSGRWLRFCHRSLARVHAVDLAFDLQDVRM